MRVEFAGHPNITAIPLEFEPADRYRVTYHVKGVTLDASKQPKVTEHHSVLITLVAGYPREKPVVCVETPVFHPNIGPGEAGEVCIGDHWAPAQSLVDVVVEIGRMIQYQKYNVRAPLNALAADWAASHEEIFPVGDTELFPQPVEGIVLGPPSDAVDSGDPSGG